MVKEFWDSKLPKNHHTKHLTEKQKQAAKAHARASGRPYPNMIDNVAMMRASKKKD